jgi:type IV pilus assembly protein PilP
MLSVPEEVATMRGLFRGLLKSAMPVSLLVLACTTDRPSPPAPPVVEAAAPVAAAPVALPREVVVAAPPSEAPTASTRDPFVPSVVVTAPPVRDDRPRKSKRFAIDELKLVGIVSSTDAPRAMLVDPRGKGWVVTRGELLGRAEIIHDGDGDHRVSWRVDRIRESEVVLVREDATHSGVPSSTKVLALRHAPVIADDAELDD